MEERKFKENDYVMAKSWEELIEEFGMIDPEVVRQKMRDDEECDWKEEDIAAYNPEVVNVPWGARKPMIDSLVDRGLMKITGYGKKGDVKLENDDEIEDIISEEILKLVSEDEVKNHIFWVNKTDEDFHGLEYSFEDNLITYFGNIDKNGYELLDKKQKDKLYDVLPYFYAASMLESEDFENGVTEFLQKQHNLSMMLNNTGSRTDHSKFNVYFKDNVQDSIVDRYTEDWDKVGWTDVEIPDEEIYRILYHPKGKGIFLVLNVEKADVEGNFDLYIKLLRIIDHVHGNHMRDVLSSVEQRDRVGTMGKIKEIFKRKDEQYKRVKMKLEIENFLKVAREGEENRLRTKVKEYKMLADDCKDSYRRALANLREGQEKLFGYLFMHDTSGEEETRQMLNMLGDQLTDFHCIEDTGRFRFAITQPMLYWDDSVYERLEDECYFEDHHYNETGLKEIMDKIFKTREYTVYFKQAVVVDMRNNKIYADRDYDYSKDDKYIPNPHLHAYDCWGDNEPNIIEAISKADYLTLFNLIQSTIAGIALFDPPVMDEFIRYVTRAYGDQKCIKVKGQDEMISFDEAFELEREA